MNMENEEDDEKRMEVMSIEAQGCNNSSYSSIQVVLGTEPEAGTKGPKDLLASVCHPGCLTGGAT
jgi:hypothetical protein